MSIHLSDVPRAVGIHIPYHLGTCHHYNPRLNHCPLCPRFRHSPLSNRMLRRTGPQYSLRCCRGPGQMPDLSVHLDELGCFCPRTLRRYEIS